MLQSNVISFPYGKTFIDYDFKDERLSAVLESGVHGYTADKSGEELVADALANPIGTSKLSELANHCSEFIDSDFARTGILEKNPIHEDMVWAAGKAKLAFIVNVVLDLNKNAIFAVAGDYIGAHKSGCEFLRELCCVKPVKSAIVITTNGGYPLDQNVYQAVKGMTAAEASVKEKGIIIMMAKSNDGHGGKGFFDQIALEEDIDKTLALFRSRGRGETVPDQWQTQVFIRVLKHAKVIYISDMPDDVISAMHMIPAHDIDDAIAKAKALLNNDSPTITAIPDGVSVIVTE